MRRPESDRDRLAPLLFYAAVILIGYLVFLVVEPFLVPLGWAGVLAVSVQPIFLKLASRVGRSRAAGVCVLIVILLLVLPVWLLVDALVREGAQAVSALQGAMSSPPSERMVALWSWVQMHVPFLAPERLSETVGSLAQRLGSLAASGSGRLLGGLAVLVLDLALALFALFFFLRDAPAIVGVLKGFLPFHDQQRNRVVKQIEDLVFASVIAGLAVAAVQGFLGGLGFWIVGVRAPAVWGTVMAFMSLVPIVGSSLVWGPVALWFLLTGDLTRGLVLIGIGGGLVGMADNILRPLLLSGRSSMNGLVTFVALLGGISAFGLIGLVFGPVVVAIGAALLDAYLRPVAETPDPV
ncbi:MAG: AI-2E family transporter [Vicinamibacteria bacterium]|nr:AI-2E family transporter [Vicinamibacteria bacterium]